MSELVLQDAVLRAVQIIGEAAVRIRLEDSAYYEQHKLEGFTRAIGLRNRLAHEYDDVDLSITWGTAVRSVPELREVVVNLLNELGHKSDLDSLHF